MRGESGAPPGLARGCDVQCSNDAPEVSRPMSRPAGWIAAPISTRSTLLATTAAMSRAACALAAVGLLTACAGPRPVGPPVDSAVSIAASGSAVDRRLLLGRWRCAQANAPAGAEVPGYSLEYTIDGMGRSLAETAGGPPGSMLAEARIVVETNWRWGTQGDSLEQSGMASIVRPGDDAPISVAAARVAQISLDSLAQSAPPVSRVEVLRLEADNLVLRPEGRPQIVACSRLR